jgi:hypothetical protein
MPTDHLPGAALIDGDLTWMSLLRWSVISVPAVADPRSINNDGAYPLRRVRAVAGCVEAFPALCRQKLRAPRGSRFSFRRGCGWLT